MRSLHSRFIVGSYVCCVAEFLLVMTSTIATDMEFILPRLPNIEYTLRDVIVLPVNAESVNVSMVYKNTYFNLSVADDFRLSNPNIQLNTTTFSNGLLLRTSGEASVFLHLKRNILPISSTRTYEKRFIFVHNDDSDETEDNQSINLLFLPVSADTKVSICPLLRLNDQLAANFTPLSHVIPRVINCSEMKMPHYDGLLLNNISLLRGIEINTDKPVSILSACVGNTSSTVRNGEDLETSVEQVTPISWSITPSVKRWSDQFLYLPRNTKRTVTLSMLSLENTTITLHTEEKSSKFNINALVPFYIGLNESYPVNVKANVNFTVQCSYAHSEEACGDIISLDNLPVLDDSCSNPTDKTSQYRWIFIPDLSSVTIVCPCHVNASIQTRYDDVINQPSVTLFRLDNTEELLIYQFDNVQTGTYRMSVNTTINHCRYLVQKMSGTYTELSQAKEEVGIIGSITNNTNNSEIAHVSYNITDMSVYSNQTDTRNVTLGGGHINSLNKTVTQGSVFDSTVMKEFNTSSPKSLFSSSPNPLVHNSVHYTMQESTKSTIDSTTNSDMSVNNRFKMVVDIMHSSSSGDILLNPDSGSNELPRYITNMESDVATMADSDGKSLVAIVISLVGALLAVGVFILMFVLNDFLSRRSQIRNTRIRPFISYY